MKKQTFDITIDATPEKVWDALWNEPNYREWTAVFSEGSSHTKTDWSKGSKVQFLDANGEGMVSEVAENIPNEFLSLRHLGTVMKGVEKSGEGEDWYGAHENYTLRSTDGKTKLTVDMDTTEEYRDYFAKTWPPALDKVKEIAEKA